ncbi:helix-turn-helix domain-containing protein [Clostridium paraputrificum]|uniref:helix-turn-helix domain-containing protein n=1 Tax=Clostridium paraputrificum TaxID=29363 RepID=UPI00325B0AA0
MQLGEKLQLLRSRNGMSQEELAERLGISRQSVSKWESGQSVPDLKKLIILSDIYNVTIDSLVKDGDEYDILQETDAKDSKVNIIDNDTKSTQVIINLHGGRLDYEYKSKRTLFGLPLIHINIGKGFKKAKGIVAIGNISYGIVSAGIISLGVLSFGCMAIGIISLAAISIALLLAIGVISIGAFSIGAISIGVFSMGALSIGKYSIGAAAIASDIAIGDYARANIAIGNKVQGANVLPLDTPIEDIKILIKKEYPNISAWLKNCVEFFVRNIKV